MIGDRDTDLQFARELGIRGLRVQRRRRCRRSRQLAGDHACAARAPRPAAAAHPRNRHRARARARQQRRQPHRDRHRLLRSHARAAGQARRLPAAAAAAAAICTSTSTIRSRIARWRSARRCGRRSATRPASAATDFCCRWMRAKRRWRSTCPDGRTSLFEGRFARDRGRRVCRPSWCRISSARSSQSLGAALHLSVRGENTHHMIEACFKGVGRALRPALRREGYDLPTTKGAL